MRGVVLAGGSGTRLWPLTEVFSKQLLPVFNKTMIYYPISILMLAKIHEILIITTPHDHENFKKLLGDGSRFGVNFSYAIQIKPNGLAEALIIAQDFLKDDSCLLILGDNIFHGVGLGREITKNLPANGSHIFTYEVSDPSRYGVLNLSENGDPISLEEKPANSLSNLAITGLYFFDKTASERAKLVTPSQRGELEITSLIDSYLKDQELTVTKLTRGVAWLDAGTFDDLIEAGSYIRLLEERSGIKIACLEEIAIRNLWINPIQFRSLLDAIPNLEYKEYLKSVVDELEA
jgi:glucose-1-phosphate thymidylyltransferase